MTVYYMHDNKSGKIATLSNIWRGPSGKVHWNIPPQFTKKLRMWVTQAEWEAMLLAPGEYPMLFTADGCPYFHLYDFHKHHVSQGDTWVEWVPEPDATYWRDLSCHAPR